MILGAVVSREIAFSFLEPTFYFFRLTVAFDKHTKLIRSKFLQRMIDWLGTAQMGFMVVSGLQRERVLPQTGIEV